MAVSYKFWNECIDPLDMQALWNVPKVSAEWEDAGETKGQKVHLSRDPDGQVYLTQTEMKAVAEIVVSRHFSGKIDPDMICAIAELESDRQPLCQRYDKKAKATHLGMMQILPKTADWLASEKGYGAYQLNGNELLLFRPFENVYFGAAYLIWLSSFEQKERSEEFVVRAYRGGTKKATHKSTLKYWQRYLSVKESLPSRKSLEGHRSVEEVNASLALAKKTGSSQNTGKFSGGMYTYWDSVASPEDMVDMWNHPEVSKEWTKAGEKQGRVHFSQDDKKRPYLSRVELKAVAEIILIKHFSTKPLKVSVLCALAEIISMRFLSGIGPRPGIMGIDYSTVVWLYREMGFRAYRTISVDDISKPFVSMYFGAAYLVWLVECEGRLQPPQYIIQAYISGPKNVNLQDTGPEYLKFEEALSYYEDTKPNPRDQGSCTIM
ncbi:uncharacterized protein LOC112168050 isoform X1 [Rosa chinensis]|uniref:uncharacterized protein LOC112168050 isoform X1 n=1 Tax=Rosa chinensis TaxID=74649 RepID=UPI000D091365|nr:uncharacterized protein LOC112168050 isoform X1 [Rosa chinensis]